jgi:thiol:disulfide interchange protein
MKTLFRQASLGLAALAALAVSPVRADPEYPKMGPDIYDARADGTAQVAAAVSQAAAEHKRVIVDFGANWCIWCRRLHAALEGDPAVAKALKRDFLVVLVDVNTRNGSKRNADVNARYGNPIQHGVPMLVVLDSDGRQLTTKDTDELEEGDAYSSAKITAFLAAWAPAGH